MICFIRHDGLCVCSLTQLFLRVYIPETTITSVLLIRLERRVPNSFGLVLTTLLDYELF